MMMPRTSRLAAGKYAARDGGPLAFLNPAVPLPKMAERVAIVLFAQTGPVDSDFRDLRIERR